MSVPFFCCSGSLTRTSRCLFSTCVLFHSHAHESPCTAVANETATGATVPLSCFLYWVTASLCLSLKVVQPSQRAPVNQSRVQKSRQQREPAQIVWALDGEAQQTEVHAFLSHFHDLLNSRPAVVFLRQQPSDPRRRNAPRVGKRRQPSDPRRRDASRGSQPLQGPPYKCDQCPQTYARTYELKRVRSRSLTDMD